MAKFKLNEKQTKVIKDFMQFKEELSNYYKALHVNECMITDFIRREFIANYQNNDFAEKIRFIKEDLNKAYLYVDKDDILFLDNVEEIINECIEFETDISIHITELMKNLVESDKQKCKQNIYDCKKYTEKVIKVLNDILEHGENIPEIRPFNYMYIPIDAGDYMD